jgi:hypothetical protein
MMNSEWKIERLPRRAYVPHFNLYDLNGEVRVVYHSSLLSRSLLPLSQPGH